MRVSINIESIRKATKKQKLAIQLNTSLDLSSSMMNLYLGELTGRPELQDYEKIYALAFSLSNLAEAIKKFEQMVKCNVINLGDIPKNILEEWEYINSDKAKEVKNKLLSIRDGIVFHVDFKSLRNYLEKTNEVEVDILEVSDDEQLGVSQLSFNIIAHNLQNEIKIDEEKVIEIGNLILSLKTIIRWYITKNFEVKLYDWTVKSSNA